MTFIIKQYFYAFFGVVLVSIMIAQASNAFANSDDPGNFHGLNTIYVETQSGENAKLLPIVPWQPQVNISPLTQTLLNSVKEVFKGSHSVFVKTNNDINELFRPNAISFVFTLSARQVSESVVVAALTLQVIKRHKERDEVFSFDALSYPFVVPASQEELLKEIGIGSKSLTKQMPDYFLCPDTDKKNSCEDYSPPTDDFPLLLNRGGK